MKIPRNLLLSNLAATTLLLRITLPISSYGAEPIIASTSNTMATTNAASAAAEALSIPKAPGAIDCALLGDAESSKNHAVTTKGSVTNEILNVEIGSLRPRYHVATLSGRGTELSTTLNLAKATTAAANPVILEVEEIHNRRPGTLGYTVQVNGKDVYFRTYDEMAAGPNHYFVQIPAEIAAKVALRVTFRNESDAPFSLSRLWAYSDFESLAKAEGTFRPMSVAVKNPAWLLPELATNGSVMKEKDPPSDPAMDQKAWEILKSRMQGSGYSPAVWGEIFYAKNPCDEMKKIIDRSLERTSTNGVDLTFSLNGSEWGGHPNGPDGLGGYFSDVKYSKIGYNPLTKQYTLPWHSTPGNTTWPTWNDPQLNKYLAHKITQAVQYFRDSRDFMTAQGATLPHPVMNQEWGFSVRDHSDATMNLAKKEGVTLTPEIGATTAEQKKWIFDNACASGTRFGEVFDKAAGTDRITVDRGEIKLPAAQTRDDNYFQTFADVTEPYFDDQWAGWQYGASEYAWPTGELLPQLPEEYYDYIRAFGKLAGPNIERACLKQPALDYYKKIYQRGFVEATPLNPRAGEAENFIPQAAGMNEKIADAPLHKDRKLLFNRFKKDGSFGPDGTVVSSRGTATSNPADGVALSIEKPPAPAVVTYKITNAEPDPTQSLLARLDCRVSAPNGGMIAFAIGSTPSDLKTVATLTETNLTPTLDFTGTRLATVDLGKSVSGLKTFYLQVTLNGKYPSSAAIKTINVAAAWPRHSGHLVGEVEPFTVKQARTFNLWLQDRAVYEKVAETYRKTQGEDEAYKKAAAFAAEGRYRSAYKVISGAESLVLPAGFSVRGHGKLGPYPVSVTLPDENQVVLVDLLKAGPAEFEFFLTSREKLTFQLAIDSLTEGAVYALQQESPNHFRVVPTEGGALHVANGKLAMEVTAIPAGELPLKLPSHLSGMFLSASANGILIETQDPALWMENPIRVPLASTAKYSRKEAGGSSEVTQSKPSPKDLVDLVIDPSGQATEVSATFGKEVGRIKSFSPPQPKGDMHNGIIELENGHRYELAHMWFMTDLKGIPPLKSFTRQNKDEDLIAALTPGKEIEISFCPYTVKGLPPRMISISLPGTKH